MKYLNLSVFSRSEVGRGAMTRLRSRGHIPGVIYGDSGTTALTIDGKTFQALLTEKGNTAALVNVTIDGARELLADIVDVQQDPITDKFLHVDFHEVVKTEKMTTVVPLEFVGESIGVKNNGGVLDIARHEISVRCFPADLPASIKIDISSLDIGDIVHLSAVVLPDGVEMAGDLSAPVVSCNAVTEAVVAPTTGLESSDAAVANTDIKTEKE